MLINLHSQATTTPKVRAAIQASDEPVSVLAERFGVTDFVKIEAEGVEIEVFDGLGELRPTKIAIDVSPERGGESPAEALLLRMEPMGYACRRRYNVLFARRGEP